jgi:hypothetical protein
MTKTVKQELIILIQYLVIAFIAEVGAFIGWVSRAAYERGEDYSLYSIFLKYEEPRLLWWFIVFLLLSAVRLLTLSASRRFKGTTIT